VEKKTALRSISNSTRQLRERLCGITLFMGALISIGAFSIGNIPVSKGFMLGTCFSVINFILLSASLPLSLGKDRKGASAVYLGSIFLRYGILAIPIIIAIKSTQFDLVSTICGIFSIQIVLILHLILKSLKINLIKGM